ncbi:hypothetical protein HK096_004666, partial [Nowakowskiella sp. JEL0078]
MLKAVLIKNKSGANPFLDDPRNVEANEAKIAFSRGNPSSLMTPNSIPSNSVTIAKPLPVNTIDNTSDLPPRVPIHDNNENEFGLKIGFPEDPPDDWTALISEDKDNNEMGLPLTQSLQPLISAPRKGRRRGVVGKALDNHNSDTEGSSDYDSEKLTDEEIANEIQEYQREHRRSKKKGKRRKSKSKSRRRRENNGLELGGVETLDYNEQIGKIDDILDDILDEGNQSSVAHEPAVQDDLEPQKHADKAKKSSGDEASQKTKRRRKKKKFLLAPTNMFSKLLLIWIFKLINLCNLTSDADLPNIGLSLGSSETAKINGDILDKVWENEKQKKNVSLFNALLTSFGIRFLLLAVWKIFWACFTWFASYAVLKWIVEYTEKVQDSKSQFENTIIHPPPIYVGHLLALLLFFTSILASICFHQLMSHSIQIGIQTRAALMVLIYRKSLKLSYIKGGVGDIVNLISNECNRIAEACVNWHFMWSAALECIIIVTLVAFEIGLAAVPAIILCIFIILPLQYFLAYRASVISYRTTERITKRVHMMSEILTAIKLIKFYAWEPFYKDRLTEARNVEIKQLRKSLLLKITTFMVVFIAPVFATLTCVLTFYYLPEKYTTHRAFTAPNASEIFTLLSLFNTLRYPLVLLPQAVRSISGATTALKRLQEFFMQPEVDPILKLDSEDLVKSDVLMNFKNASFKWDGDLDHPHITNLNLVLKRGQIVAVVGDMGSAKSLLAALMGQIKITPELKADGEEPLAECFGTCGYVPQEPWLINASIQDNILFGLEYDEKKYSDVVRLCGLTRDLMLLSNGDQSFVSDLNLSAAQSQRLSLARCLYFDPDVVLLDDTLSDFDQGTAKRLFKEAIRNYMVRKCKKVVVLVTQQKQFLEECDLILVMKGEKVNEIRLEPVRQPGITLHSAHLPSAVHKPSPLATAKVITIDDISMTIGPSSTFLNPEEANQLTIKHLQDLNAASGTQQTLTEQTISTLIELNQLSVLTSSSGVVSGLSATGSAPPAIGSSRSRPKATPINLQNQDLVAQAVDSNQLTIHSTFDSIGTNNSRGSSLLGLETSETNGGDGIAVQTNKKDSSTSSYQIYLNLEPGRVLGIITILSFFFVHGIRFGSDAWLSLNVKGSPSYVDNFYIVIYAILTIAITIGVMARGFLISSVVIRKSIALHRKVLEAVFHAPMSFYDITPVGQILSNFARHLFLVDDFLPEAALQVLSFSPILVGTVILVSSVVNWFWVTLPLYFLMSYFLISKTWTANEKLKRLEGLNKAPMFSHLSATLEGLFSIRLYHAEARFDAFNRSLIDADHKALYSVMLVKTLIALYLDLICSVFIYFTALFIVLFNVTPGNAGLALSNSLQLLLVVQWLVRMAWDIHGSMSSVSAVVSFSQHVPHEALDIVLANRPPQDWPQSGGIEFKNVILRYNRYGVAVLKSVSFRIHSGEKIVVVGRSGSGKSTLLVALLRIVELAHGEILIDGLNTGNIGLRDLRSRIAVIPQEPVMLSGTIRSNLDPNKERDDEEIWKALGSTHLGDKVKEMTSQLDTQVNENGKTFTQGERQLFCIARAILLKTTIVVFDEPATAVDPETDELVKSVMFENFDSATVIILASRFNMIMQMDKVMVMESGKITEFDSPTSLLDNPRSKFSRMIAKSAELDLTELRNSANKKGWGTTSTLGKRVRNSSVQNQTKEKNLTVQSSSENLEIQSNDSSSSIGNSDSESMSKMPRSLGNLFAPPTDGRNSPLQSNIDQKLPNKSKSLSLDFTTILPNLSVGPSSAPINDHFGKAYENFGSSNTSKTNDSANLSHNNSLSNTLGSKFAHPVINVNVQMEGDIPIAISPISPTTPTALLNNRHSSTDSNNDSEVSDNSLTRLWGGRSKTRNSSLSSKNERAKAHLNRSSTEEIFFREDLTDHTKSISPSSPVTLAELIMRSEGSP